MQFRRNQPLGVRDTASKKEGPEAEARHSHFTGDVIAILQAARRDLTAAKISLQITVHPKPSIMVVRRPNT